MVKIPMKGNKQSFIVVPFMSGSCDGTQTLPEEHVIIVLEKSSRCSRQRCVLNELIVEENTNIRVSLFQNKPGVCNTSNCISELLGLDSHCSSAGHI